MRAGVTGPSVMPDPEGRQRVLDRVGERGRRGDGAALADALDPERVARATGCRGARLDERQLVGAAAPRSPSASPSGAGPRHRRRSPRSPPPMPWATPPWICPSTSIGLITRAAVVGHHVAQELDLAGLRIDLDHRHVDRARVGHRGHALVGGRLEVGLDDRRRLERRQAGAHDAREGHRAARAAPHEHAALRHLEICLGGLENPRGGWHDLPAHRGPGGRDRVARVGPCCGSRTSRYRTGSRRYRHRPP